ncbi:uncharacterized protein LOC142748464 [Rhinoderma darwinii]|uniref:uncharacterized protein LOC142748464 n=1 Tax=Rhinoderma darwinii TaxID=43563 RepID=UPI003F6748AA
MGLTSHEMRALGKLEHSSIQRFIKKLSVWKARKEYKNIPKDELTGKDIGHILGLINKYFNYAYGAEVILALLEDIDEKEVRRELQHDLREVNTSDDGFGTIMFTDKVNFIDNHRSELITNITDVDPVLRDLRDQDRLTQEQYNDVMKKTTTWEKMRDLCDIIRYWEETGKCAAYNVLRKYNSEIIADLEISLKPWRGQGHFVDRHRKHLIDNIKEVNPVLDDLRSNHLLMEKVYKHIQTMTTPGKKMRNLCDLLQHQSHTVKDKFYIYLWRYNYTVINNLEKSDRESTSGYHFIDRHKQDLIERIKIVRPVINDMYCNTLLTSEKRDYIMRMSDTEEMTRCLYDVIRNWDDIDKDTVYVTFYKYNPSVIDKLKMLEDSSKLEKQTGDHFIDRHKQDLIKIIQIVPPVINYLYRKGLMTREKRDYIMGMSDTEQMMRHLYDIMRDRDDKDKDKIYVTLYKYNSSVIDKLKMLEDSSKLEKKTSRKTEKPLMSHVKMNVDNISCRLCGKEQDEEQDLAEVVITVGSMYRLELKSPGFYRCQKTGIKFLVKGPVTIKYKLDSWSNYLKDLPDNTYVILGPLFNIKCGERDAVSAVYLPHYLCLKGFNGGKSLIKCAHFKGGNLTIETPTRTDPFYITLENPTFSCFGPVLSFRNKKIPIHGIVLLYYKILCKGCPEEEFKIHLYVLPYSTDAEESLDKKNKKFGFQRIKKHEHTTDTVYTKIKYLVAGRPGVPVHPKTLKFHSEPYQFTEIRLQEKDINMFLFVAEENTEDTVWDAHLTQSDVKDITQSLSQLTIQEDAGACSLPKHFVDRHREALIQRTSNISPVLDNLLSQRLLTQEQYDTMRSRQPHQEAMRQLYTYLDIWGYSDKEKFYQALKKNNEPLIRDLECKDTIRL